MVDALLASVISAIAVAVATTLATVLTRFFLPRIWLGIIWCFSEIWSGLKWCFFKIFPCFDQQEDQAIGDLEEGLLINGQEGGQANKRLFRSNGNPPPVLPQSGTPTAPESGTPAVPGVGQAPENNTNDSRPPGEPMNGGLIINAKDLDIEHSENTQYWKWTADPRFTEVMELLEVWHFQIKTSMNFLGLSANTQYGAYLIFKRKEDSDGLHVIMNTSVSVVGRKRETKSVCLKPTSATPASVGIPKAWSDGWLELELGKFYCDIVTNKDAVIIMEETKRTDIRKTGLTVAGIEIRPI